MRITRRFAIAAVAALALTPPAIAQEPLRVVATFSILGDFVAQVGGDRIALTTLVGPDGDAHVYQPSPADARALAGADVVFVNGLAFEGWIDRLIEASGTGAIVVTATNGITPIAFDDDDHDHDHGHSHDHGAFDPHAWQSVTNAALYIANIERALAAADPDGADLYAANAAAYVSALDALDSEIRAAIRALPVDRRTIVTSHDAFGYFEHDYGLTFVAPQGVSTEAEASARDVARLITQIREQGIAAVFVENIADRRLLEQITAETGVPIGGTLYSDALSGPDGPAGTYHAMMRHNLAQLTAALNN